MLQEISMALTSIKAASDIILSLKSTKDETERNAKILELQTIISNLHTTHSSLHESQMKLNAENENLRKKIKQIAEKNLKRQCYNRERKPSGFFVYVYQPTSDCKDTPHDICVDCFDNKNETRILQPIDIQYQVFRCPGCNRNVPYLPEDDEPRFTAGGDYWSNPGA